VSTAIEEPSIAPADNYKAEIKSLQHCVRMLREENAYLHDRLDALIRQTSLEIGMIDMHHQPAPRNKGQEETVEAPIRAAQRRFSNSDRIAAVKYHRAPRKLVEKRKEQP
jgi:hypothetical protein